VVDREYRDRGGHVVGVYVAVFRNSDKAQGGGILHSPDVCYEANGWSVGNPKSLPLDHGGATQNLANLLPVKRLGETAYVLYWYQIEGATYWTGNSQRRLIRACRGRPFRPPVVKVMLNTSAASPGDAEQALKSLATLVYEWSRNFH
jgi:EpsI family protein